MCTLGKRCFEPAHQVEEILERQVRVQSAHDVKLGHRLRIARGRRLPRLFERHGVAGRVALLAPEGAQLAGRHAHVGGVDVAIHVEVSHVAVHPLAHMVGQPAHRQHVRRAVERQPIGKVQPLAGQHLGGNRLKARVVAAKGVAFRAPRDSACLSLHRTR